MIISDLHPWDVTYKEAAKIQKELKDKVSLKKIDKKIKWVCSLLNRPQDAALVNPSFYA